MLKKEFPILEFDQNKNAIINPTPNTPIDMPKHCVICFFADAIQNLQTQGKLEVIHTLRCETLTLPVYKTTINNQPIAIIQGFVGAAGSAGFLEELIGLGADTFLVCGGAGTVAKDIKIGKIVIPSSAIRDEGVSYHYLPPAREVTMPPNILENLQKALTKRNISHLVGKTWTTDAFFRETPAKIALRQSEGALVVEMEAAAFFAVAQFRNVKLGQILYAADDVSGDEWDTRQWYKRKDLRTSLLELSLEICFEI